MKAENVYLRNKGQIEDKKNSLQITQGIICFMIFIMMRRAVEKNQINTVFKI